jgi:hypothetical protein
MKLLANRIVKEAVDGEITPPRIGHRIAKTDVFGVTPILVIGLRPEGGDLKLVLALNHHHHAELSPHRDSVWKELLHLLRQSRRCDIEVARFATEEKIPNATANPKRGKARLLQILNDSAGAIPQRTSCSLAAL